MEINHYLIFLMITIKNLVEKVNFIILLLVEKENLVQDAYGPYCRLLRRKVEGDWVSLWLEKETEDVP